MVQKTTSVLNCNVIAHIIPTNRRINTVNIEQMKLVLREMLSKTDLTPCVVGHRGVGKSAGIIQVCREDGWRYVSLRLGQMEVGDLVGIPFREGKTMHWSRPSWWPGDDDPPTVVHCDELNRAQQEDTLQAIFQFVEPPVEGQPRALHTHRLAAQHKVVVTINPPDGTYQVATLDRALIDRMVMLYVESDHRCWARYAAARGLDNSVRQFLDGNSGLLARQGTAMDLQVEPTERAWEMISILRKSSRFPGDLEMEVYAGIIGREAAIMFMRWLSDHRQRPLTAAEVLNAWADVSDKAAAQRDDLQAATINDLTATLHAAPNMMAEQEQNLVAYIAILPRDLRFAFIKSLLKIPSVALAISQDKYDEVVYDAMRTISTEAAGFCPGVPAEATCSTNL
jgi:MoxR-like ATPase